MATNQKIKPCPYCGNDDMSMFRYDPGNWHVECEDCNYLGPASGSQRWAIKLHNEEHEATRAAYRESLARKQACVGSGSV